MQIPAVRDVFYEVPRGPAPQCVLQATLESGRPTRLEWCPVPTAHSPTACPDGCCSGLVLSVLLGAAKGSMEMEAGQAKQAHAWGMGMGVSGSPSAAALAHTDAHAHAHTHAGPAAADCKRARFGWVADERWPLFGTVICPVLAAYLEVGCLDFCLGIATAQKVRSTRPYRTVRKYRRRRRESERETGRERE